ncbi:TetR family transcriptional regulator [Rhodanobacter sp. FW510-R12]|uniref:TetR/AcrR family transcriptional regulator n=1 Tax=unclassified Rhodanobacter TaxID=2621553 RepID=UPI0007AA2F72|nr:MULTISPECIES: TetR/AcrR family transcriptional regulator [unclassified Rhodanobacter]KZC18213.1 TetR family transcriptional regulator [Rhodanobacter sp. FW104-R8]KZC26359.1 TetR family transcriptional regulator [Rhodanobacter sp. FW510-T8]KZC33604.1 TetR family transcriptional regulator [Rhodanobacter sp. FW510-R10]
MTIATHPGKRAATRDTILDHAYALACNDGLEGLSIGTLAADVGMSKSGVFAHFGSREELQLAVLEAGAARFMAGVLLPALKQPRGLPRLRAIVANWFDWAQRFQSGCVLLSATSEYDGRDGALHDAVVAQQAGWRRELQKAVTQAVGEGHLRADTDAGQLAFEIYALLLGLHHDGGLFGYPEAQRHAAAAFERLWRSWQP